MARAAYKPPERHNFLIARYFARQEFDECLEVVETALEEESGGLNEYPLTVKAMILRQQGRIQESLQLFQAATCLNPGNIANLKQVGHSLYLLGKHKAALDVYGEASDVVVVANSAARSEVDWEIHHNSGLCHAHLKQYEEAIACFTRANAICRHDDTFLQLGKVYQQQDRHADALRVYQDALDFSPENPELLCMVGLTYLRLDDHQRAFDYLGNALAFDPKNAKAILAAGSIIQDNGEMDVALHKYRVAAATQAPHSPQLWNNIGMALFGKGKRVAAVSCLKRALYLDPFEWIIAYNLGLVHLHTAQFASAFHHLSASINLKPDYAATFMCLGIALANLDDPGNAVDAFKKSLSLEDAHLTRLNFALVLFNQGRHSDAKSHLDAFTKLASALDATDDLHADTFDRATVLDSMLSSS
ncbi:hypothetical protein CTAYLR_005942 [Chrysophaeum taylorii]|uniref:Uncharacterized protein n=1 Tax=Chrysophaeum taylorii TaxID=2483200 RepID=A0AAD7XMJ4_9STRA|nr:hypothetical protein CTAYLR_005942 [Chrysophaeum taylorii]